MSQEVLLKAQRLLKESNHSNLNKITVKTDGSGTCLSLTLCGVVATYHQKQIAINIMMRLGFKVNATDLLVNDNG